MLLNNSGVRNYGDHWREKTGDKKQLFKQNVIACYAIYNLIIETFFSIPYQKCFGRKYVNNLSQILHLENVILYQNAFAFFAKITNVAVIAKKLTHPFKLSIPPRGSIPPFQI